jgi:hypothetical protein
MIDHIRAILPEELSDEAAFILTNFVMEVATALDEIYFAQSLRYMRSYKAGPTASRNPSFYDDDSEEVPF